MIIYNTADLDKLQIQQEALDEYNAGNITVVELEGIKNRYPVSFYMPGIFIRIGLFALTCVILMFSCGLLTLMFLSAHIEGFGWPLFLGVIVYVALEASVKSKNHYHSGVDDSLLYASAGLLTGAFIWMVNSMSGHNYGEDHSLSISLFVLVISTGFTLRFANVVTSAATALSFLSAVFFMWKEIGPIGNATMPFFMMLASAFVYFASTLADKNIKAKYYHDGLLITRLIGLIVLYLAGNYYVVRELGNQISNAPANTPVPFGWFFWVWTVGVPFVYILLGLRKKDSLLLRSGLILIGGTVFTFRNYYHVLPVELALTIGGVIILCITYVVTRYLKTPKHGFTIAEANKKDIMDHIKVESLVVSETFGQASVSPATPASPFGGGDAGGGGSSGTF